jgi:hypothetical protein
MKMKRGMSRGQAKGSGGSRSRGSWTAGGILECQQLLGPERLVMDLRSGLDQVLEVGTIGVRNEWTNSSNNLNRALPE